MLDSKHEQGPLFDRRNPIAVLSGEGNLLWKFGFDTSESGDEFAQLESWWRKAGHDPNFYTMYAKGSGKEALREQARDWALAAVAVSRVFQSVRGSDHARAGEQVRGDLDEAMSAYGRILGWPERPACALGDAARASADLDAHVLTNVQFIERRLAELEYPEAWGPGHPGAGMIRSALATAWRDDGLLGRKVQTVALRAILDKGGLGIDGDEKPAAVATLQLERFVPGSRQRRRSYQRTRFFHRLLSRSRFARVRRAGRSLSLELD